jgi:ribonuclease P protein component
VDFQRVFEHPERSADRFFTVLAAQSASPVPRLGLAIARKQVRRAVDRNRLKRIAREVFRRHRQQLAGLDLVVMARGTAATADNAALAESLGRHFARLGSSRRDDAPRA